MFEFLSVLFLINILANVCLANVQLEQTGQQKYLYYGYYDNCEGKDLANYTLVGEGKLLPNCLGLNDDVSQNQLVQCDYTGQKSVNLLQILARSQYPVGAYQQIESLWLATSGPLQGKYLYEKTSYLNIAYLKKCSSIIGYSYVSSKMATLLINEKLDLNVFVSAVGGFDTFQKGCTTVCSGRAYIF